MSSSPFTSVDATSLTSDTLVGRSVCVLVRPLAQVADDVLKDITECTGFGWKARRTNRGREQEKVKRVPGTDKTIGLHTRMPAYAELELFKRNKGGG